MIYGELPETFMLGETYDISPFCEFVFYNFFMFKYGSVQYPY